MANPGLIKSYDVAAMMAPVQTSPSTATTGGTLAAGTYYYVVTALNAAGETIASNELSQVTTGSTSTVTVNWGAVVGATGYNVYRGTAAGAENTFYAPGNVTTYTDTGSAGTAGTPPGVATASITLNPYSIVRFAPADFNIVLAGSSTDPLVGVTTEVSFVTGDRADVVQDGIAYVKAGGTIAAGDPITSNSAGVAIKAAPSTGVNASVIGFARQSAVSGDVFEAQIIRCSLQG